MKAPEWQCKQGLALMVEGGIFDEKTNKTIRERPKSPADNVSPHASIAAKHGEIPFYRT